MVSYSFGLRLLFPKNFEQYMVLVGTIVSEQELQYSGHTAHQK